MKKTSLPKKLVLASLIAGLSVQNIAYAATWTVNGTPVDTLNWVAPPSAPLVTDRSKSANSINTTALQANNLQLQGRESELNTDTVLAAGGTNEATVLDPTTAPLVLGYYNPSNNTLRIDILKVEKTGRAPLYYYAQFSPRHGSIWKALKTYKDTNGNAVDPFAQWQDPSNPPDRTGTVTNAPGNLFKSISLGGAQTALAHAMQIAKAPSAVLAVGSYRIKTWEETKGPKYNRRKEYHYQALGKAEWYSLTAPTVQEGGLHAWTCAQATTDVTSCPDSLKMPTLMRIQPMKAIEIADRNPGIRTPSGGLCVIEEPNCETVLYHDIIPRKKNWLNIAGAAAIGFMGGMGPAVMLGMMQGHFESQKVKKSPGTPGATELESQLIGAPRDIDTTATGETYDNSKAAKFGTPSTGTAASAGDQWNQKAITELTNRMNKTPFDPSLLGPIRFYVVNSALVDEYGAMGKTKKLLGLFNTYDPNSKTTAPGDYRKSDATNTTDPTTQPGTTQNQTQTKTRKGPATDQRKAAS